MLLHRHDEVEVARPALARLALAHDAHVHPGVHSRRDVHLHAAAARGGGEGCGAAHTRAALIPARLPPSRLSRTRAEVCDTKGNARGSVHGGRTS
eukprot:6312995-Prymnesium_polylepis.1